MSNFYYIFRMPRRSVKDAQTTRNEILETAIRNLAADGYEKLSLNKLARDCGVTRGAVYNHFADKKALFREAATHLLVEMGESIHRWAESGRSRGEDLMESLLNGTLGFLTESQTREYQQIILLDAPAVLGMEKWQEIDDRYTTSTLVDVFTRMKTDTDTFDPLALAQAFSGAMNQMSRWISDDDDIQTSFSLLEKMLRGFFLSRPETADPASG